MVQKDESEANINLGIGQLGFEPGSIFKILTEAIALNEGLSLFTTNLVMFALSRAMAEMAQTFFEMYNVPFVLQSVRTP